MSRSAFRSVALLAITLAATACDQSSTAPSHTASSPSQGWDLVLPAAPPAVDAGPFTLTPSTSNLITGTWGFSIPVGTIATDPANHPLSVAYATVISSYGLPSVSASPGPGTLDVVVQTQPHLPLRGGGSALINVCVSNGYMMDCREVTFIVPSP
jgi:hypothetical protein